MNFAAAARLVKRESDSMLKRMNNPIISTEDSKSSSEKMKWTKSSFYRRIATKYRKCYIWQEHMMISAFQGISFSLRHVYSYGVSRG